jgi:acyl carrier protein
MTRSSRRGPTDRVLRSLVVLSDRPLYCRDIRQGGCVPTIKTKVTRKWTPAELEGIVIELLGDLKNTDPDTLRAELEAKDGALPVDSLDMFDILQEFRKRTGIKIDVKKVRRRTMRSIKLFTALAAGTGS